MTIEQQRMLDDDIDTELGERYYGGRREVEEALIDDMIKITSDFVDRRFREGRRPALRDAHAKDTGCVRASFQIDGDLDQSLRHGVFVPGKKYDAWIRFSNGNSERLSDRWPDARGMAVKLMGVPGPKFLDDETMTQDFIMANNPVFFVDNLDRYRNTLKRFHSGGLPRQYLAALRLGWRERLLAFKVNFGWITNPLLCQYWSMTPYRLGTARGPRYAIKFMAKPSLPRTPGFLSRLATVVTPKFSLENEMATVLTSRDMSFDFYIQRYVDSRTPVEDSTVKWKERIAAPERVAKILIPSQDLMSLYLDRFCENLSFNPWHCLEQHKPLGAVNRVRKRVYLAISERRHQLNRVAMQEPSTDKDV
jgi:Catalase